MSLSIVLAAASGLAVAPAAWAATTPARAPSWHVLETVNGSILHYSRGAITAPALPSPGQDESTHADGVSRIPGTTHALAITSTFPYDSGTRFYSQILQYS